MIQTITLPGTEAVLRVQGRAKENFVVCDLPGFAEFADRVPDKKRSENDQRKDWYGGLTYDRSLRCVAETLAELRQATSCWSRWNRLFPYRNPGVRTTRSLACVPTCHST